MSQSAEQMLGGIGASEANSEMYEVSRKWYCLALPLMYFLAMWAFIKKMIYRSFGKSPRVSTLWFDGLGGCCKTVRAGVASWRALDIIYKSEPIGPSILGVWLDRFWLGMRNCQAVRNRLKLGKKELWKAVNAIAEVHGEVRILSLASGSAQGVIELLSEAKKKGMRVSCLLVDRDETAHAYALSLAKELGVSELVSVRKASISQAKRISKDFSPHIVEMLGFLDYLPQEKAVKYAEMIRSILPDDGVFITCNVFRNAEKFFVTWVIDWWMIYRTPEELVGVARTAGFASCRLVVEPQRIHGIIVAKP